MSIGCREIGRTYSAWSQLGEGVSWVRAAVTSEGQNSCLSFGIGQGWKAPGLQMIYCKELQAIYRPARIGKDMGPKPRYKY